LRNNPGGEISVALSSADPFINKAEVRTRQFDGAVSSQETNDGVDYDVPIVLLVNENTASSAEIFTALLKQYADTTIIGTNTFGKGIYQNYAVFKGNYLQYTAGYTEVGDWETYNEKGIAPDIEIAMDYDENIIGTDEDIQLQKAIEILG
jgi:carboxyl-terminal processing protease